MIDTMLFPAVISAITGIGLPDWSARWKQKKAPILAATVAISHGEVKDGGQAMVAGQTGERLDRDVGGAVQDPPDGGEHVRAPLPDQEQARAGADRGAQVDAERSVAKVRMDPDRAPAHQQDQERDQHQRDAG